MPQRKNAVAARRAASLAFGVSLPRRSVGVRARSTPKSVLLWGINNAGYYVKDISSLKNTAYSASLYVSELLIYQFALYLWSKTLLWPSREDEAKARASHGITPACRQAGRGAAFLRKRYNAN